MRYHHIIAAAMAELWAIDREKLTVIVQFLSLKSGGEDVSPEEVARITQAQERQVRAESGAVGLLPVYGTLAQRMDMMSSMSGGTSHERVAAEFRSMLADDQVKAIVMNFDSPGGTVAATEELSNEVFHSRGVKPIVAQVDSMMMSAAYWIGTAADEVVVTPGGRAGSVGAYSIHEDVSGMLEKMGVKKTVIASSDIKTEGTPFEPLSDEARANIQARVDHANDRFERTLARNRGVSKARVRDRFGQGAHFAAEELVDRGMADRIATLPETLERFGVALNPIASRSARAEGARAAAAKVFEEKVRAGEPLTKRELEHGLKGLVGLTNSEAERAVRLCFKSAQGEPEARTGAEVAKQVETLRRTLDNFKMPTL